MGARRGEGDESEDRWGFVAVWFLDILYVLIDFLLKSCNKFKL